jgi:hypothetical protein
MPPRHSATLDPAPRRSHETFGDKLREAAKHAPRFKPLAEFTKSAKPMKSTSKKLISDAAAALKKEAE